MERSNGNDFAQHIAPNGTGHQNYYSGRGHQIIAGSGTIHNYYSGYPTIDNSREKIMQALYTSPYLQRKDRNPDRVPGTCEWFMNHHDFHHWRDNTSSSLLWVSANPGCGKSVLAKYLVNELKTTEQRTTCYFFFKDDFEDQRSARGALSCMLHQLFIQRENLLSAEIIQRFKSYKAPLANSYYELWELWDILAMATQDKNAGEIICILDAFDECVNQERQDLAKLLREFYGPGGDTKGTVNLKLLITSRPYDTIRRDLIRPFNIQECPVIHLKGDGDAEVEKIAGEISLYIKDRVSHIRANLGLTWKEEEILLQGLAAIPNQTYLWVYLTLEWIETEISNKINEAEIRNAISILPRTVDEAYNKILARSTDVKQTRKLLHIVVAAERPVTLAEMDLALAIRRHHKSYKDLALRPTDRVSKHIRELCGLFISITDEKIYLLHQTAKEFLVRRDNLMSQEHRNNLTWKFSFVPVRSHRIICKICIQHLLFKEFKRRSSAEILTDYVRDNLFLDYSAKNWAIHFRESDITENEILEQLQQLCNVTPDRCPIWFEIYWINIHRDNPSNFTKLPLNFTKLMIASNFGLGMIVRQLIESPDAAMDSVDGSHQRTALSLASENGFDEVVQLLIKGPKFHAKEALKKATRQTFSKGANVNIKDRYGRTALFYAAWNGHMTIVQRLVKAGARMDVMDSIGGTPISYALCYGHEKIANELMRGAQPDSVDEIRRELLLSAVEHGHDPIVKRLLDSGADPGATDDQGNSLVTLAIKQGKRNIIDLLIERGANVNKRDRNGKTPLILAINQNATKLIELLLEKGADANKCDLYAIHESNDNVVDLLLRHGADPTFAGDCKFTPLEAAKNERENINRKELVSINRIVQMLEAAIRVR
ncbi:ankyrin repeat-containing domain protein [Trichoderma sp. SZMC 28011]